MSILSHSPAPAGCPLDAELWRKLSEMQLDSPGARLTFTKRLARDNGWSLARAHEVVEEYRRFLYLAARAGHPVTPSDAVDQAWHLHLVYTRHYWGVLCRDILGFDLHHGPTLGGASEQTKFGDWYARTLASYRAAFGEPRADIWPNVDDRFAGVERMQRLDVGSYWMIQRPPFAVRTWIALAAAALLLLLLAAALLHGGIAGAFLPGGAYSGATSPDPAVAIGFVAFMIAAGLFAFVIYQTRSLLGSLIIAALLLLAVNVLPRGDAVWTSRGLSGYVFAAAMSFAAFAIFSHLYRTRHQRPNQKGKGGCGGGGGGGGYDGCGGGSGCGGGGCGG